jgi:hypothetical protein
MDINYLRTLLALQVAKLKDLKRRKVMYPELAEAIAYRTGRVEAYRELIQFLSSRT